MRLLLFVLMLLGLVLSASIPKAFEERALPSRSPMWRWRSLREAVHAVGAKRHDAGNHRNFLRITIWRGAGAACWIAGRFVDGPARLALWALARRDRHRAPLVGFWVPGLGRSTTADWNVEGAHMAERCGLFVIIALGESILITGQTFAGPGLERRDACGLRGRLRRQRRDVGGLFQYRRGALQPAVRGSSDDPGRLARSGYTYLHIPIVAGIIVAAVGDELVLHHPGGHTDLEDRRRDPRRAGALSDRQSLFKWLTAP